MNRNLISNPFDTIIVMNNTNVTDIYMGVMIRAEANKRVPRVKLSILGVPGVIVFRSLRYIPALDCDATPKVSIPIKPSG